MTERVQRFRPHESVRSFGTVALGTALFTWPAFLNGYPLVFSDTGGFLEQALMPDTGWDKPWIYGPFLTPFHWRLTLWPAMAAQCLLLSALLWLTQATLRSPAAEPSATRHLLLCTILAAASAAPWFATLLMPDILAPLTVLALFLLAHPTTTTPARIWLLPVATIAIASHLAHLVLAAAVLATLLLLALLTRTPRPWRPLLHAAAPLVAALALLLATNLVAFDRLAISPYGATFALARLTADGPARTYLQQACPEAHYRLCAWSGRLPTDSDAFLWDPNGPVWANGYGPLRIAPEAATIVRQTILTQPGAVLAAALHNTWQQLLMAKVGDALVPDNLPITVTGRLRTYFPPAEAARFEASRQAQGTLPEVAAPLEPLRQVALILGALATTALAITTWRTNPTLAHLSVVILVALLANAAVTGALSGPHDRYQARIAWLVLVPPLLYTPARYSSRASAASRNRT